VYKKKSEKCSSVRKYSLASPLSNVATSPGPKPPSHALTTTGIINNVRGRLPLSAWFRKRQIINMTTLLIMAML
jgi:anthranilate/para-aminobenzoate synthase component II